MCALPFHVRRRQVTPADLVQPRLLASRERQTITRRGGRSLDVASLRADGTTQQQHLHKKRGVGLFDIPTQTRAVQAVVTSADEEAPALAPFGADPAAWAAWAALGDESMLQSLAGGSQRGLDPEEEAKRARAKAAHEMQVVKDRRSGALHHSWSFYTPYFMALRLWFGLPIGTGYSRILSWLFVGDFVAASDDDTLLSLRVSHLWTCAAELPEFRDDRFVTDKIYLKAKLEHSIASHWITVFDSLDHVQTCRGCAFLYCNTGGERSAAVVVAYLMYRWRIFLEDAFNFVILSRPTAMPSRHYMIELAGYEVELFGGSSVLDSEHWDFFEFKRWKLYNNPTPLESEGLLKTIKMMWPEDHEEELDNLLLNA